MNSKGQRGITLAALVVTVVILLILSTVAISIAVNGDGLFNKADNTVQQYNNKVASEEDVINKAWSRAVGIKVNHNGTEVDISSISASEIANYYGDTVTNYTTGGTYQLFYVDNDGYFGDIGRIYIQNTGYYIGSMSDSIAGMINPVNHFEVTGIYNTNSLIYKLNPAWAQEVGTSLTTMSENNIMGKLKGIAFLCNTENWNPMYVRPQDQAKGVWAIGGIPVEMYCLSYNAKVKPDVSFSTEVFSMNDTPVGYAFKPAITDPYYSSVNGYSVKSYSTYTTVADDMYVNNSNDNYIWMASPNYNYQYICALEKHRIGYEAVGGYGWARPVVSIPADYRIEK
ncbi:MAG: hypothetical protein IKP28_01255 [Clostridia bacterium]|nr:hypothetical protein [Clostridia bacterium]